jgi:DNA adenine methylase
VTSVFRYPGGKAKRAIAAWILSYLPEGVREYREPFVGGGGVYFQLEPSAVGQRWINDKHEGLVAVYQALDDRPEEFSALSRSTPPAGPSNKITAAGPRGAAPYVERLRAEFDAVRSDKKCDQAFRYFYLNRTGWGGRVNYDVPSRQYFSNPAGWNIVSGRRLEEAAAHIRGTKITCGDYAILFSAPGYNVWIYADPPYLIQANTKRTSQLYQHVFTLQDHLRLAETVKACRHAVAISYNDDPDGVVRSLYPEREGFRFVEKTWPYCGTTRPRKATGKELLILKDAVAKVSVLCG